MNCDTDHKHVNRLLDKSLTRAKKYIYKHTLKYKLINQLNDIKDKRWIILEINFPKLNRSYVAIEPV